MLVILLYKDLKQCLLWALFTISGINVLLLIHWIILVPLNITNILESIALIKLDFFYYFTYLTPLIIILLLFSWMFKIILKWGWNKIPIKNTPINQTQKNPYINTLLIASITLSIIASIYPYLQSINPQNLLIGVDTEYYINSTEILDSNVFQAFNITGGSRPLIHLAIFSIIRLTGINSLIVVKYFPILLNPLLTISVFFITYQIYRDEKHASWAAFFTASGYQVTINMYSFFLTNMLGLVLAFFSLGFLFRTLREDDISSLLVASLLGTLLVFTHPWTLSQYFASVTALTGFIFYRYRTEGKEYKLLKPLIIYLGILVIAEIAKSIFLKGFGGMAAISLSFEGLEGFFEFWSHNIFSIQFLYGGLHSNLILILLAIAGAFLLDYENIYERYFTILIALTSTVFLIGTEMIKSRLLFNLPIGIFAALGFLHVLHRIENKKMKQVLTLFIVSTMCVYLFQSLAKIVILSAH
jgi:hypothetical protein